MRAILFFVLAFGLNSCDFFKEGPETDNPVVVDWPETDPERTMNADLFKNPHKIADAFADKALQFKSAEKKKVPSLLKKGDFNIIKDKEQSEQGFQNTPLPDYYNAVDHGLASPIQDQGNCGSCWAFATAGSFSDHLAKATKREICPNLSEQFLMAVSTEESGIQGGCQGAYPWTGFENIVNGGCIREIFQPYTERNARPIDVDEKKKRWNGHFLYRASDFAYSTLPENRIPSQNEIDDQVRKMKEIIYTKGSILIGIAVYEDFMDYSYTCLEHPIYEHQSGRLTGYHAMRVVGWNDNPSYWIVANSWGKDWGLDGFCFIKKGINTTEVEQYAFWPVLDLDYFYKDTDS